jgi:hypothetical protein
VERWTDSSRENKLIAKHLKGERKPFVMAIQISCDREHDALDALLAPHVGGYAPRTFA